MLPVAFSTCICHPSLSPQGFRWWWGWRCEMEQSFRCEKIWVGRQSRLAIPLSWHWALMHNGMKHQDDCAVSRAAGVCQTAVQFASASSGSPPLVLYWSFPSPSLFPAKGNPQGSGAGILYIFWQNCNCLCCYQLINTVRMNIMPCLFQKVKSLVVGLHILSHKSVSCCLLCLPEGSAHSLASVFPLALFPFDLSGKG